MRRGLTFWVVVAMALGVALGAWQPDLGVGLKVLPDLFVRLVKMAIAPVIFVTVVTGIANMGSLRRVGRLGAKALLYFEVMSTASLALGLAAGLVLRPGTGFVRVPGRTAAAPAAASVPLDLAHFVAHVVPDSFVGAFAGGELLQVLLLAVLVGVVLLGQGAAAAPLVGACERVGSLCFGLIEIVMKLSPLAALGAMAYTVGAFGLGALLPQARLLAAAYLAMGVFVGGVLGAVAALSGFSLRRLLGAIRAELGVVLGTSSSESVLPSTMATLQRLGCSRAAVGLVVPTGYAFNLDGTAIYLSLTALFIAQAYGVELTPAQMGSTFAVLLLTSKGAAGVTGSGLVTLTATLTALPEQPIPPEGIALIIGVDRFMSMGRALTNLVGNCVATVVLARAEGEFVDRGLL